MKIHHFLLLGLIIVIVGFIAYGYLSPEEDVDQVVVPVPDQGSEVVYPNNTGLSIPEDFSISIYSDEVPSVRVLALDNRGVMLASLMNEGTIVALPDENGDGVSDETEVLIEGLNSPHGILVLCDGDASDGSCLLYVAETDALMAYPYTATTREVGEPIFLAELPDDGGHFTRSLHPHPNGQEILVAVGSNCNACQEDDERRATVLSYNIATGELTIFASGLRNTVFMATDPVAGEVWGTDHGRDQLGDDLPPDEVNILSLGDNYGWPFCYGKNVPDTTLGATAVSCAESVPSHIDLQAHSAPLGLAFVPEEGWPEEMRGDLLIAYHGSWNRSVPTGYAVVRFDLSANSREEEAGPHDFLTGFLEEGEPTTASLGRPVAVLALPGGTVYVSDDKSGVIYRMQYRGLQ